MRLRILAVTLAGLLAIATIFTQPDKSGNSALPLFEGAHIEPRLLAIFERSCGDCHSERTAYPFYSYVAPSSWLVKSDVAGGRRHFNMSHWNEYPLVRRERLLSEIANQVKDRDMPLSYYTWIHRHAVLSDPDIDAVFQWTQAERARLINGS